MARSRVADPLLMEVEEIELEAEEEVESASEDQSSEEIEHLYTPDACKKMRVRYDWFHREVDNFDQEALDRSEMQLRFTHKVETLPRGVMQQQICTITDDDEDESRDISSIRIKIRSVNPLMPTDVSFEYEIEDTFLNRLPYQTFVQMWNLFEHHAPNGSKWKYDFKFNNDTLQPRNIRGTGLKLKAAVERLLAQPMTTSTIYQFDLSIMVPVKITANLGTGPACVYASWQWSMTGDFFSLVKVICKLLARSAKRDVTIQHIKDITAGVAANERDDELLKIPRNWWKIGYRRVEATLSGVYGLDPEYFRQNAGQLHLHVLPDFSVHLGA